GGTLSVTSTQGSIRDDLNDSTFVQAPNIVLKTTGGEIGATAAVPLQIDATTLDAQVTSGTGGIHVRDTAGGLNVVLAQTPDGDIILDAAGPAADLTLTTGSAGGPVKGVALSATGAVHGTPGGTADVTASFLSVTSATGVGTAAAPLETAVGGFAASVGNGGVAVANAGRLSISFIATVPGITATG